MEFAGNRTPKPEASYFSKLFVVPKSKAPKTPEGKIVKKVAEIHRDCVAEYVERNELLSERNLTLFRENAKLKEENATLQRRVELLDSAVRPNFYI